MDDTGLVGGFQRVGDLSRDRHGLADRERMREALGESGTLDQFQHQGASVARYF